MDDAAVFLDKDGTLLDNVPYSVEPSLVRLSPGALEGLRLLADAGYRLHVISNQSGLARGFFDEGALMLVRERIQTLLAEAGLRLDGFYYCPHLPEGRVSRYSLVCSCRKPRPGLILRAAAENGLDLERSWLVGDILDDVEAGRSAGCRTVLLDNGNETEWQLSPPRLPHHLARDLEEAARIITAVDQKARMLQGDSRT
jgi:D-glycero-D-manno-heptose 1,7-bisphosphate phosphatase